jgi:hypothetical protein
VVLAPEISRGCAEIERLMAIRHDTEEDQIAGNSNAQHAHTAENL